MEFRGWNKFLFPSTFKLIFTFTDFSYICSVRYWKSPLNGIPLQSKSPQWFHGLAKGLLDKVENRRLGEISVLVELFLEVVIQCCSSAPLMSSASICKASYTLCGFTGIVTKPPSSNAGFRLYHFMLVYHGDCVGLHRHGGVLNLFCGNTQSTALTGAWAGRTGGCQSAVNQSRQRRHFVRRWLRATVHKLPYMGNLCRTLRSDFKRKLFSRAGVRW